MKIRHQLLSLLACMPCATVALAQVPEIISYQGRVTAWDTNFTGAGQFKFALVSASTNAARQATATATVSGGGATNWGGTAYSNSVAADFATIGGGMYNTNQTDAHGATISTTPVVWTPLPHPYQTCDTTLCFIETAPAGNKFYRLQKP